MYLETDRFHFILCWSERLKGSRGVKELVCERPAKLDRHLIGVITTLGVPALDSVERVCRNEGIQLRTKEIQREHKKSTARSGVDRPAAARAR